MFLKKWFIVLPVGVMTLFFCLMFFFYLTDWIWPEFNGSHSLGNNIYMVEWDGGGRMIVKGTNIKGNACSGGERLIPTYVNQYDSIGNVSEYVVDAKADDKWVIVKTDNRSTHQKKYYIINKKHGIEKLIAKDIIEKYIVSFIDSTEFSSVCHKERIQIEW